MFTTDHWNLKTVISGGQTGVDRGALEAAIYLGIPHGGWCPRGRLAEDGRIPDRYQLREGESAEYPWRTLQNVIDSDGTLILYRRRIAGGTQLTVRLARERGKPYRCVDLAAKPLVEPVRTWLTEQAMEVLNVAGPRESSAPGIAKEAFDFLCLCLRPDHAKQFSELVQP